MALESRHNGSCNRLPCAQRGTYAAHQAYGGVRKPHYEAERGITVIILGVILLILGWALGISILWTIGAILAVVGVIFWILGGVGRPVAGRRYWY